MGNSIASVTVIEKGDDFRITALNALGKIQITLVGLDSVIDAAASALAFAKKEGGEVKISIPDWLQVELRKAGHTL